jgi:hypothetical protein
MTDLSSAAFRLALRGLYVFPCKARSKLPATVHGFKNATNHADVVRAWWDKAPTANIGVATGARSGVWCLDVDPQHGGNETLTALLDRHGRLPRTVQAHTPSGGLHYWFKWPGNPEIRNSVGRVGQGIDVRGAGGYVVAAPSVLPHGRYRWAGKAPLAPAPDWLVALTQRERPVRLPRAAPGAGPTAAAPVKVSGDVERYVAAAIRDELTQLKRAQDGQRNNQLNRSAFAIASFVKAGLVPEAWAVDRLETIAAEIDLPAPEASRTIASAFQAAQPREIPA